METPTDLRYSESHEWVRVAADDTAAVGITDFAQSELGDIVYVELPEVGQTLTLDDPFGSVESVKAVSDLIAPVSGEVVQVNTALADAPESINQNPYESWLVMVKLSDRGELDSLMTAEKYEDFTETA
jgi:glycine cleavage system H protein